MADTTTATSWPASTSRLTWCATLRMRSMSATDVPPNFITSRAMVCRRVPAALELPAQSRWSAGQKGAYTYRRGRGAATAAPRLTIREQQWPKSRNARAPQARSTRPRSSAFPRSPPNGGTRAARWPRCTSSIRCGIGYIRDQAARALRARCQAARFDEGPAHPRHRLRRRPAVASRWPGSARTMVGVDPSDTNIAAAKEHAGAVRACDRLPLHHGRGAGRGRRAVRHRAGDGGGRARRRRAAVRRKLRRDGEARRADDRRHAQPHAEKLCARDRRRRIHPALASGRQPPLGQVRHAERARDRDGAGRSAGDRRARA